MAKSALLSRTHVVRFHGAPREGCQPGWTPGTHCDYSVPTGTTSVIIEVTHLELAKADIRGQMVTEFSEKSFIFPP